MRADPAGPVCCKNRRAHPNPAHQNAQQRRRYAVLAATLNATKARLRAAVEGGGEEGALALRKLGELEAKEVAARRRDVRDYAWGSCLQGA
jgi:hypothetical protein